ncbi:uncharacterized protein [Cicer arietinum]|uniref:uncharacterized protein n=1 Tax=Cicer arietinum TaxID=3827 RepID=UPI003CC69E7A
MEPHTYAVENGPYIPSIAGTGDSLIPKPRSEWSEDDMKKVGYNSKAKNIITSILSADEFFRVSNCKTAKEIMKTDESINDLQTRFTHIINNLHALGKVMDSEQQIGKVMRCLTREWQPKITVIAESKDIATMTIATLFGKLREHEMELHRSHKV